MAVKSNDSYAEIGDLVFCHACGSKYGWVLNQLGLVRDVVMVAKTQKKSVKIYKIWIFNMNRVELVENSDFEQKNLELVSRANGNNEGLKFPKIVDLESLKKTN